MKVFVANFGHQNYEWPKAGIERFSPDDAQYGAVFRMDDLKNWIGDKQR